MLKTTVVLSVEVRDENLKQDGKKIQVDNWDEKESVQKSRKGQPKGQKTAKSKK